MILRNRYKDQMSKIYLDDNMKNRVMNRIREVDEIKVKAHKKLTFKGKSFFKYSGVIAACCAFIVTYAVTIKYPKLTNYDESSKSENENALNIQENKNEIEKDSSESIVKNENYDNNTSDNINENNFTEGSKIPEVNQYDNKKENYNINEDNKESLNKKSNEIIPTERKEVQNNNNIIKRTDNVSKLDNDQKKEDQASSTNNHENSGNDESVSENQFINDDENLDNNRVKAASYDNSIQNKLLSEYNAPNLIDIGYNVNSVSYTHLTLPTKRIV